MKRFFVTPLAAVRPGESMELSDAEAHHLRDVLRIPCGEAIEMFDGEGRSCRATIVEIARRCVTVRVESSPESQPSASPFLWLAAASPKSERLRWLIEKATELGVDRITPLRTARTVVLPGEGKLRRLEDAALQACKQCGRHRLPAIDAPLSWADWWTVPEGRPVGPNVICLLADPAGPPLAATMTPAELAAAEQVVVLIGPEGGFTEEEVREARERGARPAACGRHILRIETAALAFAATVRSLAEAAR